MFKGYKDGRSLLELLKIIYCTGRSVEGNKTTCFNSSSYLRSYLLCTLMVWQGFTGANTVWLSSPQIIHL